GAGREMVREWSKRVVSHSGCVGPHTHACVPTIPSFTAYYGLRRFLLIARSFSLDRSNHPYRRLSATLILARSKPVQLHVESGKRLSGRALLISPRVERQNIVGNDCDVAIFDVSIGTPEFNELRPALKPGGIRVLDEDRCKTLEPCLDEAFHRCLNRQEASSLFAHAVHLASDGGGNRDEIDGRVCGALEIMDQSPFNELSPGT